MKVEREQPERPNSFTALAEKFCNWTPHFHHFGEVWGRFCKHLKFSNLVTFTAPNLSKWSPGITESLLGCSWIDSEAFWETSILTIFDNFLHPKISKMILRGINLLAFLESSPFVDLNHFRQRCREKYQAEKRIHNFREQFIFRVRNIQKFN